MNCKNCGNPLKENQNFCSACGTKVEEEPAVAEQTPVVDQNPQPIEQVQQPTEQVQSTTETTAPVNTPVSEGLGTASLVLGIISLILTFVISFFILPVAIIGLVLGIINKRKKGKKIAGIILNAIAIVINVGIILITVVFVGLFATALGSDKGKDFVNDLYTELDYSTSENFIAGKYNCTNVDGDPSNYVVTLHLNEDNTFFYGPYGNTENNYAKGNYTFEDEKKTNATGKYKYFMVTMKGNKEDFIVDGKPNATDFDSKMEMGVTTVDAKKQAVIMFVSTYNTYYCYEE